MIQAREPAPTLEARRKSASAGARGAMLALFAALAILHTWPLARDPTSLSRNDSADTMLNEWIITWVAHQAPRNPLGLFDANIFHPEPRTLAYSEHLLVPSLMAAPISWLGGSPVLAFNLLLIAGFALTGWSTAVLVHRWTGDWWAGIIAGSLAAFNSYTLTHLPHVQLVHAEFLPLALLALDDLLRHPRARAAAALVASFCLQALCSGYLLVFSVVVLTAGAVVRREFWRARVVGWLAAAGCASAVCLLPFLIPYWRVQQDQGLTRPLDEVARFSASAADYLSTASRLHLALWSERFYGTSDALFPGFTAIALAGVAAASGAAVRDARARMAAAFTIAAIVLSFGPTTPIYAPLYLVFPLLSGIRGASRFGWTALFGLAILAGFGVAHLRERRTAGGSMRAPTVIGAVAFVLVTLEALRAPMGFTHATPIPPIYEEVAAIPNAVLAEFPFFPPERIFRNAPFVLASTRHFAPILNGYSGFTPPSYERRAAELAAFPDERSMHSLRAAGATHVLVHFDQYGLEDRRRLAGALSASPEVGIIAATAETTLYRLLPSAADK